MCVMAADLHLHLVGEFLDFWTANVDPSAMSLAHTYLDNLCKNKALVKKPLTRLALALVMYTEEGCLSRTPPSPNVCGLVTTADLGHLEKTPLVAEILEQTLAKMEKDWRPILTNAHGPQNHEVAFLVRAFQLLMARAALGKKLDPVLGPCTVLTGKLTVEKANELAGFWAKSVDSKFPSLNFSKVTGLSKFQTMVAIAPQDVFIVGEGPSADAPRTRQPIKTSPPLAKEGQSALAVGTPIVVTNRTTMKLPLKDNPNFRKDIPVRALGRVESATLRERDGFVLVRIDYVHDGVPVSFVDYLNPDSMVVQGSPEDPNNVPGEKPPEDIIKVIQADHHELSVEPVLDWESLITDHGDAATLQFIKARANLVLDMVMKEMPLYTSSDLMVLHTVNKMGARQTEVWTMKDFAPGELMFAPFAPEIKDRMFTHLAASHLHLNKKMVPGNKVLALDGRNQGHLSHVHPSQHRAYATGSLFWCITKTQDKSKANLTQQSCEVSLPKVRVVVPGKEVKHVSLAANEMPQVHVLTNLALVKKHTRLVALDDVVVARAREHEKKSLAEEREKEQKRAREAHAVAVAEPASQRQRTG